MKAARQPNHERLAEARDAINEMSRPDITVSEFYEADVAFHIAMAGSSNNEAIYLVCWRSTMPWLSIYGAPLKDLRMGGEHFDSRETACPNPRCCSRWGWPTCRSAIPKSHYALL